MKVSNYIYDKYNERGMKSFQNQVKKFLKGSGIKEVICHNAYMSRANGYGSYNKVIEIEIDQVMHTFSSHTNDSLLWDSFEPTTKNKRDLFLAVISEDSERFLLSL